MAAFRLATRPLGPRSPRWQRRRLEEGGHRLAEGRGRREDSRVDRPRASRRRWLLSAALAMGAMMAVTLYYSSTRPRLLQRGENERLQHAYAVAQSSWQWEPRAV